MKHLLCVVLGIGLCLHAVSAVGDVRQEASAPVAPLIVTVTTNRRVYRLQRPVRITLTESNTSDRDVTVAIGCHILSGFITHNETVVWIFRDYRRCLTGEGVLPAGRSRTFPLFWDRRFNEPGVAIEPGVYVIHAGIDGISGTTGIRLRRRRSTAP